MSFSHAKSHSINSAFTLIELLIVVAIIAILTTFVVLILDPGELLSQARDGVRLSDMSTLNQSLGTAALDQLNPGSANTIYISIPDPAATSTAGDQCQGLGLSTSTLASGWSYHCAASSTYLRVDGTGWIPINFSQESAGSPISQLPVDPTNQSSTDLYYLYVSTGPYQLGASSTYAVAAMLESNKYLQSKAATDGGYDPDRFEAGNNLSLVAQAEGLAGWWPFNEGTGTTAYDSSGNGNNGILGCQATNCLNPTYGPGRVGSYAVQFSKNGSEGGNGNQFVTFPNAPFANYSSITLTAWIYPTDWTHGGTVFEFLAGDPLGAPQNDSMSGLVFYADGGGNLILEMNGENPPAALTGNQSAQLNAWQLVTATYDSITKEEIIYLNGQEIGSQVSSAPLNLTAPVWNPPANIMGYDQWNGYPFDGLIGETRIYSRALSPAEVQAFYNAEQ